MPLDNFGGVAPGVFRSAQPEDSEAWGALRDLGVKSIIKLNTELESPASVEARGIGPGGVVSHCEYPPLIVGQFQATMESVRDLAFRIKADVAAGLTTLIHCTHGRDRTGMIAAAYQILVLKLPIAEALRIRAMYGATGLLENIADAEIVAILTALGRRG